MISPRISSTRGDLGAETLRRELLAFDPPDAGPGTLALRPAQDVDLSDDDEEEEEP